jgi:DNA-binding NarL/FixJ family response regulator
MFTILVLDKRDGIKSAIKYLLHRYEIVFFSCIKDAVKRISENNIDLILINLPMEGESREDIESLKEQTNKKKTLALADIIDMKLMQEASEFGVIGCLDKIDIGTLPEVVNRLLNQAITRVLV